MYRPLSILFALGLAPAAWAGDGVSGDDWLCTVDGEVFVAGADEFNACENAEFLCETDLYWLEEADCNPSYESTCAKESGYAVENIQCNLWRADVGLGNAVDPHLAQAIVDAKSECYDVQAQTGFSECTQLLNCHTATQLTFTCLDPCNPKTWYRDLDGDGYGGTSQAGDTCGPPDGGNWVSQGGDCNDNDGGVNPGVSQGTWYLDGDGDGYGQPGSGQNYHACQTVPADRVANDDDCDDSDPDKNPTTDVAAFTDGDGDGYGAGGGFGVPSCNPPAGTVSNNDDCDDGDAAINPQTAWYPDGDLDGYGAGSATVQCAPPGAGYVLASGDCDDTDAEQHPAQVWFPDIDGDGDGAGTGEPECAPPSPWHVSNDDDCDDNDAELHSGTGWYLDADGDGHGAWEPDPPVQCAPVAGRVPRTGDCDDTDAFYNADTAWYADEDGDGLGGELVLHACGPVNGYFHAPCTLELPPYAMDCQQNANGIGYSCDLEPMFVAWFAYCPISPSTLTEVPGDLDDADPAVGLAIPMDADRDGWFADRFGRFPPFPFFVDLGRGPQRATPDCDDRDPARACTGQGYRDADGDGLGDPRHVIAIGDRLPAGYVARPDDVDDRRFDRDPLDSLRARPGTLFAHDGGLCTLDDRDQVACLDAQLASACPAVRGVPEVADLRALRRVGDARTTAQMLLACLIEANALTDLAIVLDAPNQTPLLATREHLLAPLSTADCVRIDRAGASTREGRPLGRARIDARQLDALLPLLTEADDGRSCTIPRR